MDFHGTLYGLNAVTSYTILLPFNSLSSVSTLQLYKFMRWK